jgi:hypothetical protein
VRNHGRGDPFDLETCVFDNSVTRLEHKWVLQAEMHVFTEGNQLCFIMVALETGAPHEKLVQVHC